MGKKDKDKGESGAGKRGRRREAGAGQKQACKEISVERMEELLAEGSRYRDEVEPVLRAFTVVDAEDLKFRFN
ncbi:MAG: hypothetical protein EA398_16620 [Deltaproteobacteria bacterium]|nr:MAG: hypothetical protein EA398_16620 [Deltaproteobacteria bacterium]